MKPPLSRRRFFKAITFSALGLSTSWMGQGCKRQQSRNPTLPSVGKESTKAIAADIAYASGGTAVMAATYPDPFNDRQPTCILTCAQTKGPCYAPSPQRQDISEGETGLPFRLAFQLVQAQTCQPIANAKVDLWQTNAQGIYSGETPAQMCHGRDSAQARAARQVSFLRGSQISDEQGRLAFHSIYPGWYPGRTPHLHLQVTIDGKTSVITQLYFDEQLSRAIYQNHPDYRDRGPADTTNRSDGIFNRGDSTMLLLKHQRMEDGILLAYATLGLRSSTNEPLCGSRA